jgi:hypothetical protein
MKVMVQERDGPHHGDWPYVIIHGTAADAFIALLFCVRRLATRRPVLSSNPLQQFLRRNLEDGLFGAEIVIEGSRRETAPIHDIAYVRGVQADRAEDFPSGCFNGSTILLFCDFSLF